MVSQGFFSGSEKRSKRLAGQKENKIALGGDNLGSVGAITAVGAIGSLGIKGIQSAIEGGKRLKENIEKRVNPERETSFFSPSGIEVGKVASSDLSNLRVGSPEVRIANVQSYTEGGIKPYAPDRVEQYIKESETKSYKPQKEDSYVSADSYKPDVKTFDQKFGEAYKTHKEKREQVYSSINKDLNVSPLGDANPPSGIETKLIGNKYKYVKDGQELTRKEKKELEKDMALRTQLGKFVRDRQFKEMSALSDAERASYEKNMPDPDDRKIDFYTGAFPGEKVKPFEQRKFDYQRQNINYGTAEDGTPTATISGMTSKYGEDAAKVYGTEQLKKFIAADAKEKFESEYRRDFGPTNLGKPMPSNFVGGVSGLGKESDDFTSRYKSTAGDEQTRLQKAKEEQENRNVFQKVGDAVGNVFNKLTGTEAAAAGTLQAQGINTGATTNLSQMGNVSPTIQAARDAVAKANLRKSGLDRTIGGQSSQANYGRASKGFGTGTHGKGMPSNPAGMRQKGVGVSAGNLSRHKAGSSISRGGISRSTSRGQGSRSSSRSKGGTGTGKSSQGSKSSARGAKGSAGSRGRGGTGSGSSKSNTGSKRSARGGKKTCDIRCKIDISSLIESNLVKDNLAELAYFVQEIKK